MLAFSEKKKRRSCTGSLCAHMHGSVLPVPVLCLGVLPRVCDKSGAAGASSILVLSTLLGFSLTHNNNSERRNWFALAVFALEINYSAETLQTL